MHNWGQAARVHKLNGLTLYLDQMLDDGYVWPGQKVVALRSQTGEVQVIPVTRPTPGVDNSVVLAYAPSFEIFDANSKQEPTYVAYGESSAVISDWVVTSVEPKGQTVTIQGADYVPTVYDNGMPHQKV
jgi:hypothetical protein